MKLISTSSLFILIIFSAPANAQKKYLDSSINKNTINTETHVINSASEQVNKGIDNVFSGQIFKKKSKGSKQEITSSDNVPVAAPEAGKTMINISNTDYKTLSGITDAIKSNQQVTNVERTFSNNAGTLKVSHSCTSDQLFDDLVKKAGDKFEVIDISPGKITLKIK